MNKSFKKNWISMRKGMNLRALASMIYNQLPDAANTTAGSWKSWAKTKLQQAGPMITTAEQEEILEMVEEMVGATYKSQHESAAQLWAFLTSCKQKGMLPSKIIEALMEEFRLSRDRAQFYYDDWQRNGEIKVY